MHVLKMPVTKTKNDPGSYKCDENLFHRSHVHFFFLFEAVTDEIGLVLSLILPVQRCHDHSKHDDDVAHVCSELNLKVNILW